MCVFSTPSVPAAPAPPPLPPPSAAPPTAASPLVRETRQAFRARAALAGGRAGTIVTSGQGLTTPASTAGKKLLGE